MTTYCEATNDNALMGCYGKVNHEGKHWSYSYRVRDETGSVLNEFDNPIWQWDSEPVSPTFTQAEVGILLTCLQPVTQFFPELVKKLEGMK